MGGTVFVPATTLAAPFVTISPILAEAGTITVTGDDLVGGGQLLAPGNVSVTITNNSPAFLRTNPISLPQSFGGTVFFDGGSVASNSDIQKVNKNNAAPGFSRVQAANDSNPPQVTITNTYKAGDPLPADMQGHTFANSPDIDIEGDISAPPTVLTLSSKGSVEVDANIDVGKVTITAGGNFIQRYQPGLDSTAGDPASIFSGVTSLTEANAAAANPNPPLGNNLSINASANGTPVQQALNSAINNSSGGSIIAGNDVFISAQYLNVDGTIQSGVPLQSVTIDSNVKTLYNQDIPNVTFNESMTQAIAGAQQAYFDKLFGLKAIADSLDATDGLFTNDYVNFLLPEATGDNIEVFYNASSQQLVLGQVDVQGGLAVLFGDMLNTGSGQINVLDGDGQIKVVNNTSYPLVTASMSTGQGTAGKLQITDTGKENASGQPLVTVYFRQNGTVFSNSYYANPDGSVASVVTNPASNGQARTATYQPAAARIVWEDGQDLSVTVTDNYQTSSWASIIHLDSSDLVSSMTQAGTPAPLLAGEYVLPLGPGVTPGQGVDAADYEYNLNVINNGTPTTQSQSWQNSTWYGTTTYYEQTVTTTPKKNINTNSIRADRPIAITFTGFDQGDPNEQVNVSTQGDLYVDGSIANTGGQTTLSAPNGSIIEENDGSAVGGRNLTLSAADGIGANDSLKLAMDDSSPSTLPNPGVVNATTGAGDINLDDVAGSLRFGTISTPQGSGNVTLTADESLFPASSSSLITGGAITLNADFGTVGTLGGGTASAPGAGALPVIIDVGSGSLNKLNVTAQGDVNIEQTPSGGDLRLNKINSAAGNVRVWVPNGNLVDANNVSVPDTQNLTELMALWNSMLATQSTAQVSITNTINAYQNQIDQEYQSYWQFRNEQPNPSVFDPNFQVTLPAGQITAWTQYYTTQGQQQALSGSMLTAFVQSAITTLENQQTQEYHTLNTTFGKLGSSYIPDYRYYANQTPLNVGANIPFSAAYVVSLQYLSLPGNPYTTGQAVVYHANGGSVSGLTDGSTYYAVVNPGNSSQIALAASYANATATTPVTIALTSVVGSSNTLSTVFQTFGPASIDPGGFYINLPQNVFSTGQAVVYHANGGSVAGLTDGQTYYVVLNPNNPIQVGLDASSTDANTATPTLISNT